jgi:signal transduction histidine kinase
MAELSENVISELQLHLQQKNCIIEQKIPPDVIVLADGDMITQVIRNLLSNAIKFSHDDCNIQLYVKRITEEFAEFVVEDHGEGLSEEDIKKLFRLDVDHRSIGSAGEKGSGLGLILCKEFVERNGGDIWVESEISKGCRFIFSLPVIPKNVVKIEDEQK